MTLNRVQLIGHLGRDPEVRYTPSGAMVANFSIATTERWKGSDGQRNEKTEWHRCVAWRAQAELVQNYLKKGNQIYLEGRLETQEWTDNENVKRYRTEIVVSNIRFLGSPKSDGGGEGRAYVPRQQSAPPPQQQSAPPPPQQSAAPQPSDQNEQPYMQDDVPF